MHFIISFKFVVSFKKNIFTVQLDINAFAFFYKNKHDYEVTQTNLMIQVQNLTFTLNKIK